MTRTCSVCSHPQRQAIDRALLDGAAYRTIADRFGLSETALKRHRKAHVPAHVAQAAHARQVIHADDLLAQIKGLRNKAISILTKAEAAGDYRTALAGIREARACIETLLEVEGELDRRAQVNITLNREWIVLRALIVAALAPHPEALTAVVAAIEGVDDARA